MPKDFDDYFPFFDEEYLKRRYDIDRDGELDFFEEAFIDAERHRRIERIGEILDPPKKETEYDAEDIFSPRQRLLDEEYDESDLDVMDFDDMDEFEQEDFAENVELGLLDQEDEFLIPTDIPYLIDANANELKESDYPDKRLFEAAQQLDFIERGIINLSRKQKEKEIKKCKFILESNCIAAKYLTVGDGFNYGQALKDHFEFPISIQEEHLFDFDNLFNRVAQKNCRVAVDMWIWCVNTFGEYQDYMDSAYNLYNSVLVSLYESPKDILIYLIDKLKNNNEFIERMFVKNPDFPASVERFIAIAFESGNEEMALEIFNSVLKNPKAKGDRLEWCISGIISECETYKSAKRMTGFEKTIYPIVKEIDDKKIQRMLPRYKERIYPYINYIHSKKQ